jgi:hypothetical protein
LDLPELHPAQNEIASQRARFNVLACGRRWGKSIFGLSALLEAAVDGYPVAWFSPTYRMLADTWRQTKEATANATTVARADEHRIELIGGGTIDMWSLDSADTSRGRRYARVVLDEAAMVAGLEDAWQNVIRPTLTDFKGDAFFLSTPRGHNYFWRLWTQGQDETQNDWRSWRMPTSANPYIDGQEIEAARRQLPEQVFAQEYLAAFIEDSGLVFRRITDAVMSNSTAVRPDREHSYVCGLDWGKLNDYTVISIIDATTGQQVLCDRFNRIDYDFQLGRLWARYDEYKPWVIVAESNSVGEPLVEQLQRAGLPVRPFQTTPASKTKLIEDLALAFERQAISILDNPVQTGELLAFGAERLPSGAFRYAAPGGGHDDTVMALALAWSAIAQELPEARPGRDPFNSDTRRQLAGSMDLVPTLTDNGAPAGVRFQWRNSKPGGTGLKFR